MTYHPHREWAQRKRATSFCLYRLITDLPIWTSSKMSSFAVGQQCLRNNLSLHCKVHWRVQSGYFKCACADYLKPHVSHSIKVRGISWAYYASMSTWHHMLERLIQNVCYHLPQYQVQNPIQMYYSYHIWKKSQCAPTILCIVYKLFLRMGHPDDTLHSSMF